LCTQLPIKNSFSIRNGEPRRLANDAHCRRTGVVSAERIIIINVEHNNIIIYVHMLYEYGYNMEYCIITVCQSNDSLVNIDFEVRAAAERYTFYTAHTIIIELVIYYIFIDRNRGEAFLEHFSLERRPIAQSKRVILRVYRKCRKFMDVHVLVIC